MERKIHYISAEHLTLDTVRAIIREGYELRLSDDAKARIIRCREYLDKKIATAEAPIYGVTTGFGSLCKVSIDEDKLSQLQINLMMSHACGEGDRVPTDVVRLMIFFKIQSLSYGYSTSSSTPWSVSSSSSTTACAPLSISRVAWAHLATSCRWLTSVCRSSASAM